LNQQFYILESKASGLFVYAKLLRNQLNNMKISNSTKIDFNSLDQLPIGLNEMFLENFKRTFLTN